MPIKPGTFRSPSVTLMLLMDLLHLNPHHCPSPNDTACCCPCLERLSFIKYLDITLNQNVNFFINAHFRTRSTHQKVNLNFKSLRNMTDFDMIKMIEYALCQYYCLPCLDGAAKSHFLSLSEKLKNK